MSVALKKSYHPTLISCGLLLLFVISLVTFWYQAKIYAETIIAEDITTLVATFKKIDEECGILDFKYQQQNYIDFLNVISFEGSEVGTMHVLRPKQWKGPYLQENFTIQGKYYQVVKTKKGYFIVPGTGVRLKSGKVIGKDILLDERADIESMTQESRVLNFKGKPLAARIAILGEHS